jgi:excisionase family DNA binding protein
MHVETQVEQAGKRLTFSCREEAEAWLRNADEKLSLVQAAPVVGVSPFTVRAWVRERRIPFFRCGRRIVFSRRELETWLAARRVAPAGEQSGR